MRQKGPSKANPKRERSGTIESPGAVLSTFTTQQPLLIVLSHEFSDAREKKRSRKKVQREESDEDEDSDEDLEEERVALPPASLPQESQEL